MFRLMFLNIKNLGIVLALLLLGLGKLSGATNYCDPELCTFGQKVNHHIGCNNKGEFSNSCDEPSVIPITSQLVQTILHTHNDLRNKLANGTLVRFESAKRMPTITWDSELEYLATLNGMRCKLQHDQCHNTETYKFSGQNMAILYQSKSISRVEYESIISFLINEWFMEHKDASQGDLDKYTVHGLAKRINHFTVMVHEKTSRVGCGIVKFFSHMQQKKWSTILMTCNYSFDNIIGIPIYIKGPKCAACQTGCNPEFNGLCSVSENVLPIPDMHAVHKSDSHISLARSVKRVPSRRIDSPDQSFTTIPPPRYTHPVSPRPIQHTRSVSPPRTSEGSTPNLRIPSLVRTPTLIQSGRPASNRRRVRPNRSGAPESRFSELVRPLLPIPTIDFNSFVIGTSLASVEHRACGKSGKYNNLFIAYVTNVVSFYIF